jgi:aromatic ring-opening dioxygenase catalytic subunit (LigB family)
MPRATTNRAAIHRENLTTLEGAWVDLRKMTYGERIRVRELSMDLSVSGSKAEANEMGAELRLMAVSEFEFICSIVDHNLEDEAGGKLDFSKPGVVQSLDPAVGEEIDRLISDLNSPKGAGKSS